MSRAGDKSGCVAHVRIRSGERLAGGVDVSRTHDM